MTSIRGTISNTSWNNHPEGIVDPKQLDDLAIYGMYITKDGQRIDPKDFFVPLEECTDPRDFGRRRVTSPRERERQAAMRMATGCGLAAVVAMICAFALNQPVLALFAMILLVTGVIVAKDA